MFENISFLCTNPWEHFLPAAVQSHSREYFELICRQLLLKKASVYKKELLDIYGEYRGNEEQEIFRKNEGQLQLLYVQSARKGLVEKVFCQSDLVVMGLPGGRRELERMFLTVHPWKNRILFLWDGKHCRGEEFVERLCLEYKLRDAQMIQIPEEFCKPYDYGYLT